MGIRFVTVVTHIENLELRKDTAQIPYQLGRLENAETSLVSYYYTLKGGRQAGPLSVPPPSAADWEKDYPFLATEVPGLNLHFLADRGRGKFFEKAVLDYLRRNAKKIDILNLFHFNAENVFYTLYYKLRNPQGKVYLKLDIDLPHYKKTRHFINATGKFGALKAVLFTNLLLPVFFRLVHTVSAESIAGLNYFRERFNAPRRKLAVVKNGVDANLINQRVDQINTFDKKENIIVTVGRIGTAQKNNKMLLSALEKIELSDWKVYFIGSVEQSFQLDINEFFQRNPNKRERVFFTGYISKPADLYQYYNRAKIFCLTSIDEGFPISACEALYFGNYLVLSDQIDCFDELTQSGTFGKKIKVNDIHALAGCLNALIAEPKRLEPKCESAKVYAETNLTWQAIIPKLYQILKSKPNIAQEKNI